MNMVLPMFWLVGVLTISNQNCFDNLVPEISEDRVFPRNERSFFNTFIEIDTQTPLVIYSFLQVAIAYYFIWRKTDAHLQGIQEDPEYKYSEALEGWQKNALLAIHLSESRVLGLSKRYRDQQVFDQYMTPTGEDKK
jgi:hypothetical protein